ncbi:hypothetical protein SAMN05216565_101346 [Litchfieldia salsa]|uniref:Uncharacterized protein n=1 Tax=Litchfieldia salsa TaxID=930152 RepID=A0A1H0PKQ7_9BACI|nr:hypothetical protein SAMN05216565_101346 [Litchfieldia salsa]
MDKNDGCITFRTININGQSSNSGVFIGGSQCHGWRIKEKQNVGLGPNHINEEGQSSFCQNINSITDHDCIDHFINSKRRKTN